MAIHLSAMTHAIEAIRERYRDIDNVLGACPGTRSRGGEQADVLVVWVHEKRPLDRIEPHERLPKSIGNIPVDVRELPRANPSHASEYRLGCGHASLGIDEAKLHRLHVRRLEREGRLPAPAVKTLQVGNVFVIEDNGTLETGMSGDAAIDWVQAYRYFRQSWDDAYDFVAFYVDTASGLATIGNSSFSVVKNDIEGIGLPLGIMAGFESTRLQGVMKLLPWYNQPDDGDRRFRLHELGHRWLAYVDFRDSATGPIRSDLRVEGGHWSTYFDTDPSSNGGSNWRDNGDGTFTRVFVEPARFGYNKLERYLLGVLPANEVERFFYLDNVVETAPNQVKAEARYLTVENIILAHGERTPTPAASQRTFRTAFVVLTKDLETVATLAANTDLRRDMHVHDVRDATSDAARCGAVMDTYLYTEAYDGVYIADDANDTGVEPSTDRFWNSPDIWVRNADDDGKDHQAPIRGRDNFLRVRVHNRSARATGEVTVNLYSANFVGLEFVYPEDWVPAALLGSQKFPSIPPGGEVIAKLVWPSARIPDASWHPCLLAEVLPTHPTLTRLRHTWQDRRIAQKNITIVDPPAPQPGPEEPPSDPPPGEEDPIDPCDVRFRAGSALRSNEWIGVSVRQVAGPRAPMLGIDLGTTDWSARCRDLPAPSGALGALPAEGGAVATRRARPFFAVDDPERGGTVWLPRAGDRPELTLKIKCDRGGARYEVTQRDTSGRIVGGFDVIVREAEHDSERTRER